jgi:hypothetical protein
LPTTNPRGHWLKHVFALFPRGVHFADQKCLWLQVPTFRLPQSTPPPECLPAGKAVTVGQLHPSGATGFFPLQHPQLPDKVTSRHHQQGKQTLRRRVVWFRSSVCPYPSVTSRGFCWAPSQTEARGGLN